MSRLLLVFQHAAWRSLRGKRAFALVFLGVLPPLVTWLYASQQNPVPLNDSTVLILMALYQFVIPFAALLLGVAVLGDEIEGRTLTYLFTRPLVRPLFFLGRLFGSIAGFGVLLAASTWLTLRPLAADLGLGPREVMGTIGIALAALAVYTAIFAVLRAFLKHALFVGFLLTFIVEGFLSKLPASGVSKVSVWHHAALLQSHLFGVDTKQLEMLGGIDPAETVSGSLWTLAIVFAVACALGAWIVRVREVRLPAAVG